MVSHLHDTSMKIRTVQATPPSYLSPEVEEIKGGSEHCVYRCELPPPPPQWANSVIRARLWEQTPCIQKKVQQGREYINVF